jgi:hypothetical protein
MEVIAWQRELAQLSKYGSGGDRGKERNETESFPADSA